MTDPTKPPTPEGDRSEPPAFEVRAGGEREPEETCLYVYDHGPRWGPGRYDVEFAMSGECEFETLDDAQAACAEYLAELTAPAVQRATAALRSEAIALVRAVTDDRDAALAHVVQERRDGVKQGWSNLLAIVVEEVERVDPDATEGGKWDVRDMLRGVMDDLVADRDAARAEVEQLRAERDRLQRALDKFRGVASERLRRMSNHACDAATADEARVVISHHVRLLWKELDADLATTTKGETP